MIKLIKPRPNPHLLIKMASLAAAVNSPTLYSLSTEIHAHTGDVRALLAFAEDGIDYLLTASRDKTACLWTRPTGSPDLVLVKTITQHTGFVSALCVIPPDPAIDRPNSLLVTAGQDKTILVHSMDPAITEPVQTHVGHKAMVSCVIYQCGQLVSVSWDGTMRVWADTGSIPIDAHQPAVWCVTGLYSYDGTKRVLTGGADKAIKLWEGGACVQEYRGHSDVVRDVRMVTADTFLSASNDCSVRKWNIHSAQCLMEFHGHEAYVYSISIFPGLVDDFISSGEDGTVRVWRGGSCVQTICVPAISVWCVCVMSNGQDIACGSSDSVVRVFTTALDRLASPQQTQNFLSQVEQYKSSKDNQSIDVEKLPGLSALTEPGKSTGDTKLINNDGKAEVYQWNASSMQWEKIGDAVGKAPEEDTSKSFNGKEYDYVFDIEIDDEGPNLRKLKLPYNKSDDPYQAAETFIVNNDIPACYLDQIAEFIMQNAEVTFVNPVGVSDPYTGGGRYVPSDRGVAMATSGQDPFTGGNRYVPGGTGDTMTTSGQDPFTGGSRYVPGGGDQSSSSVATPLYLITGYKSFTSPSDYYLKVIDKLKEFSSTIPQCELSESDISDLVQVCVATPTGSIDQSYLMTLTGVLSNWPLDNLFPVLDILRLSVLNKHANSFFTGSSAHLIQLLERANSVVNSKNQLLILRVLANVSVHVTGRVWLDNHLQQILEHVEGAMTSDNRNCHVAMATVVLNYSYHCCLHSNTSSNGLVQCIPIAIRIIQSDICSSESKYRALLSIGTTLHHCKDVLLSVVSCDQLSAVLAPLCDVTDHQQVAECALQLLEQSVNS